MQSDKDGEGAGGRNEGGRRHASGEALARSGHALMCAQCGRKARATYGWVWEEKTVTASGWPQGSGAGFRRTGMREDKKTIAKATGLAGGWRRQAWKSMTELAVMRSWMPLAMANEAEYAAV